MSDEYFTELVDGFIRIIKEALTTTPMMSYTTTALIVDHRGDIGFEMIVDPDDVGSRAAGDAAYELGRVLASRRSDIAAVLVAEELLDSRQGSKILISVGTPGGLRNAVSLPLSRAKDGTLRVKEASGYVTVAPGADLSMTAGSRLIQGLIV